MDEYIGIIKIFAGTFAPVNYALCNGATLPISQYQALFSILGTTYGGNGTTNFQLPNLNGSVPVGVSPSITQGQVGGSATQTLTINNLPAHTHIASFAGSPSVSVSSGNASQGAATAGASIATPGSLNGRTFAPTLGYNTAAPDTKLNAASVSMTGATVTNAPTGGSIPINIMQPYLGVIYIICTQGIYPSRP